MPDREPPAELSAALDADPAAGRVFAALPHSHQMAHRSWVAGSRTSAMREARAAEVVRMLHGYDQARRREDERRRS